MTSESVRESLRRAYRFVISPKVSLWLLGAWFALFTVWVLPFTVAGQSEETVSAIALEWLPLRVIYWATGVATVLCIAQRFLRDLRRCKRELDPKRAATLPADEKPAEAATLEGFKSALEASGFTVRTEGDFLSAVKGAYRPLWGSVFHLSLVLVAVAFAANLVTTTTAGIELIEGQSAEEFFASTPERSETASFRSSLASLRIDRIEPAFHQQYLLFEKLEATADYKGRERRFTLARPLWLSPISYISLQDFNYAPHVVVTSVAGKTVEDTVSSLELFPPGSSDHLDVPAAKIRIQMQVYPDHAVVAGRDVSKSYNLAAPKIQLTVFERVNGVPQQRVLARRLVELGEPVTIPDGTQVKVEELRTVGTFRLMRAPFMPVVVFFGVMAVAGAAGRLLFPRIDIIARREGDGFIYRARVDSLGHGDPSLGLGYILAAGGVTR